MTTTHEVTIHNGIVRVVTKVNDEVSMTHEYTVFDWTDHIAATFATSSASRKLARRGDVLVLIYTEADYE